MYPKTWTFSPKTAPGGTYSQQVEVPEDPKIHIDEITMALIEFQLSEGELKRVQRDLDSANARLDQKEKQLDIAVTNDELVNKNL